MGVSRFEERLMCAMGIYSSAPLRFESCEAIPFGGVLLLLPFLLECGLMSFRNHYCGRVRGYYSFSNLFIIIAFMYLCRIKSFEQIKHHSPGEFGKLVGYDRIPEVRKLRGMLKEITAQNKASQWSAALSKDWIYHDQPELYYIDGHVQVYHGYLANLGKKYVSRQRLCLPGVMEFWVNAGDGSPYFYVTAEINEKMIEMLKNEIIPKLLTLHPVTSERKLQMEQNPDVPLFTLIFDREAFSISFFKYLWDEYRIAVITYRKNTKDKWDESLFKPHQVSTSLGIETMDLHEKSNTSEKGEFMLREVRKLSDSGHQTSIVSSNKILPIEAIASHMFARWTQEIFFRYMRQEYALDKIIQYSVNEIDSNIKVVNIEYNNITYKIKKEREKLSRFKAKLFELEQKNPLQEPNEIESKKLMKSKIKMIDDVQQIEIQIENLIKERKNIPYKIPISQMPESTRYNQLDKESKMIQNIIKMICYRAETAFANLLSPHYKRANQEIRALIKSIINTPANLEVCNEKKELVITLYPLSNLRSNKAVSEICETINASNTIFPDTDLKLFFKIATAETVPSQDS